MPVSPVLAIGIDAADPAYVRELMAAGDLPVLAELAARGSMGAVESPAWIGSGAVWPTFFTGEAPAIHGVHSAWAWNPRRMRVGRADVATLAPAWRDLEARGVAIGYLDVPFSPRLTPTVGCAVVEWGAHDWLHDGSTHAHPASAAACVRELPRHPFAAPPVHAWGDLRSAEARRAFLAAAAGGTRDRAALAERLLATHQLDLFVAVCSEVHRASHLFWHAVDPAHPGYEAARREGLEAGLRDLFRETDRLVGRLLQAAGPEETVLVCSLHGMRASPGVPDLLTGLIREAGFATEAATPRARWRERARSAVRAARGYTPAPLKAAYHALLPGAVALRVAGPDERIPDYEWARTECFPLPTDQHGWLRVNLQGREAFGTVTPAKYEETCARFEAWARGLRGDHGRPLVLEVRRTAVSGAPPAVLPDLVIHWDEWAVAAARGVEGYQLPPRLRARNITGQHHPGGWYIEAGGSAPVDATTRTPQDLARRLATLVAGR